MALTKNKTQFFCEKLVLAVTGSVGAAAVVPGFILLARKTFGRQVQIVLSESAQHFVTPYVATLFSGQPAIATAFDPNPLPIPHIQATQDADVLLIMPATANIIAKAAYGIADDLVSSIILAAECPVVFVPNMNESMWKKPATKESISRLKSWGYGVIEPTTGMELASFEPTFGVMPNADVVLKELLRFLLQRRHPPSGERAPLEEEKRG